MANMKVVSEIELSVPVAERHIEADIARLEKR